MSKKMRAPDRPSSKSGKNRLAPLAPKVDMSVKMYFQRNWRQDVRVFQTDNRTDIRKFQKAIRQVLKLRDNEHILIKWQDSTGDVITISSDSEMQLATKHIRHTDTLKIAVQLLEEVSSPTLCDKCDQTIICNVRYKCEACMNFVCCVRCYQTAPIKTQIHEHELYKEKYPCYCPMHRVSERDVPSFPPPELQPRRPVSAVPPRMLPLGPAPRDHRSSSLPGAYTGGASGGQGPYTPGCLGSAGTSHSGSMEDLMRGLHPTSPPYEDFRESAPQEHNYRTSERSEVVRGPNGQVYQQQQMSVFQNPESGVVAIRARKSTSGRSKSYQLG